MEELETHVAETDGEVIGLVTVNRHNEYSAELHVMAVDRGFHGSGVGRRLVEHVQGIPRAESFEFESEGVGRNEEFHLDVPVVYSGEI